MRPSALYICYLHLSEPLVQTQVVPYLRELSARGIEIHLLTFERAHLSNEQKGQLRQALADDGIIWHQLRYHQRPSLPATLYDITVGIVMAMRLCLQNKIQIVHARGQVPGAMALVLQRLMGVKFLYDLRGLLAEEYADGGNWQAGDLKFRLTKAMERLFLRHADAFVMLTQRIKDELTAEGGALQGRGSDIKVIPCCVDTSRFTFGVEERAAYRQARNWVNRRVLIYAGKLSLWYLPNEMAHFFASARQADPNFFFQVLTQDNPELMQQALGKYGVSPDDYDIRFVPPQQVPLLLSAADAAISFIQACPSKRASSPTKIGEYLAAGLPVIANTGIGDCDNMLLTGRLGVIVREFTDGEYHRAITALFALIGNGESRLRCREFAASALSLAGVGGPRYAALYELLLGTPIKKAVASASELV